MVGRILDLDVMVVAFQKWRWTEIAVTLGLVFVASIRKEWPMTFIAVRCLTVRVSRSSNAAKRLGVPSATHARTPLCHGQFPARLLQSGALA